MKDIISRILVYSRGADHIVSVFGNTREKLNSTETIAARELLQNFCKTQIDFTVGEIRRKIEEIDGKDSFLPSEMMFSSALKHVLRVHKRESTRPTQII